ncbi:MAG TPA: histidine kinase [Draconibacterium sp.]|nr:histidine kinase [Draconibacterium sp.]
MMQRIKIALVHLVKNKVLQHLVFWLLSFLILLNVLRVSADIHQIDVIYTAVFHVSILLIVYINLQVLFPLFLEKGRYFLYSVSVLATIALGSVFYIILFDRWIDYIFTGYYFIAYYSFWDISLFFVVYVATTSLLHLARGWFRLQEIEREKTLAELKALKSQINPHFLFNSLNSIYSLARKNSMQVPDKILQLSDLMRHIIYESDVDFIPLEKEIGMVKNYMELQNLRTSESEKIQLEINGNVKNKKIAPLLFLPFVENSFKHGLKSGAKNAFVNILITVMEYDLIFEIENAKGDAPSVSDSNYKGLGIENVKKRLDLIYSGKHELKIGNSENTFKVLLKVPLTRM